jgi:polar amino acid transport system substrate-binding protein
MGQPEQLNKHPSSAYPTLRVSNLLQVIRQLNLNCLFFCLSFCLLLAHSAPLLAQTKVPLLFGENKNEKGELIPLGDRFTKVFSAIEKDVGIKFDLQMYPWNRAVKLAGTGHALIFGLSRTPEREEIFTFSEPAMYQYLWLVTRSDRQFSFNKLDDLKGKTIGVVRGSKYGGEFDAQKNKLFKTDDDIDAYAPRLKKVLSQRIDAMIFASGLTDAKEVEKIVNSIKLYKDAELQTTSDVQFSVLPIPVLKDGICFAILKGKNDTLIKNINKSLQRFHAMENANSRKKNLAPPKT